MSISFPSSLVAGDTWTFCMPTGNYGSGYTALITFAAGSVKLSSAATQDGDEFRWSILGTETAPLVTATSTPFLYTVTVTDGSGNRYTVETGAVTVARDINALANVGGTQTNLQLMLAACDATLINLMSQKTSMVQFAGQMYQFHELDKLFAVRDNLVARVADEQDELRGAARFRKVVTIFQEG